MNFKETIKGEDPKQKELKELKFDAEQSLIEVDGEMNYLQKILSDHAALAKKFKLSEEDIGAALNYDVVKEIKDNAKSLMISVKHFKEYTNKLLSSEDISSIKQNRKILSKLMFATLNKIDTTREEIYEKIKLEAYKQKRKKEFHMIIDGLIKEESIKQSFKGNEQKIFELLKNNKFYSETLEKIKSAEKSDELEEKKIFSDDFNKKLQNIISEVVENENRPRVHEINISQKDNKLDIKFYGPDLKNGKLNFRPLSFVPNFYMKPGLADFNKSKDDAARELLDDFMFEMEMTRDFKLTEQQHMQVRAELARVLVNHVEQNIQNYLQDITIKGYANFTEGNFQKCKELADIRAKKARLGLANQYGIKNQQLIDKIKIESVVHGPDIEDVFTSEFDQQKEFKKFGNLYNTDLKEYGLIINPEDIKDKLAAYNEGKLANIYEKTFFDQYIGQNQAAQVITKETSPLNLDVTGSTGPTQETADAGQGSDVA